MKKENKIIKTLKEDCENNEKITILYVNEKIYNENISIDLLNEELEKYMETVYILKKDLPGIKKGVKFIKVLPEDVPSYMYNCISKKEVSYFSPNGSWCSCFNEKDMSNKWFSIKTK